MRMFSSWVVRLIAATFMAALMLAGCQQVLDPEQEPGGRSALSGLVKADTVGISNEKDLQDFADAVLDDPDTDGVLLNDIVLTQPWTPIGTTSSTPTAYTGTFNGAGYSISGLNVKISTNFGGLFAVNRGTIQNLTVNGTVSSSAPDGNYVGGIVGYNSYTGYITNVTSNVTVTAIGAGANGCWNVGGIAGFNGCDTINKDSPDFDKPYTQGGFISQSINLGNVSGAEKVGGIAGENAGTIDQCVNRGDISGNNGSSSRNGVGGIAGRNGNNNNPVEYGTISSCYNTGSVSVGSGKWLGGLTGFSNNFSVIANSYDIGAIDPNQSSTGFYNPIVGGRDNFTDGKCVNNYSLEGLRHSSTSSPEIDYTVGIVTASKDFQDPNFPPKLGKDFKADTKGINNGYPILNWQ